MRYFQRLLWSKGDDTEVCKGSDLPDHSFTHQHVLHVQGVGVDAPKASDLYYRLHVEKVFYVGGMSAAAESLSREV